MKRVRVVSLAVALASVVTLGGCSIGGDEPSESERGAIAAVEAYVAAIAEQDPEAADAMTDPEAVELISGPDDDVDIRAALPDALEPIADPWVTLLNPTREAQYGPPEYVLAVSYTIGDLTGGDTVTVRLEDEEHPGDVDSWLVTEPLIGRGTTYAEAEVVPESRIGEVSWPSTATSNQGVWGYPGRYLHEPIDAPRSVQPLEVVVGAADSPDWDESLAILDRPDR